MLLTGRPVRSRDRRTPRSFVVATVVCLVVLALLRDADDVHELLVRLTSLSKTNAQDKVVAVLWFLATHHASERRAGWWRVEFAVNHQLIADMCGITRESTSLVMKDLLDKKIIRAPKLATLEINTLRLNGLN